MSNTRDPYASSPAAYAVVALGLAAAVVAVAAIAAGWPLWITALIVFVCTPLAALGTWQVLAWLGARREARSVYDQARANAYGGRPPGVVEVLDDLARSRPRFPTIPAQRRREG